MKDSDSPQSSPMSQLTQRMERSGETLFLNHFLHEYVDRGGLGAMPKADADALILYLYTRYSKDTDFNVFELSRLFKIKESRVKALVAVAGVKFESRGESYIWMQILKTWKTSVTEVEDLEKGTVAFKFENPAYLPLVRREARHAGGTLHYSESSESLVISLALLFKILDTVCRDHLSKQTGHQQLIGDLLEKIKREVIGERKLQEIRKDKEKKSKLAQIISAASSLASIGTLVKKIFLPGA